jgi:hypothetical protein
MLEAEIIFERQSVSTGLHCAAFQKTAIFIALTVVVYDLTMLSDYILYILSDSKIITFIG